MARYRILWQHFPKHSPCSKFLLEVVACFDEVASDIASLNNVVNNCPKSKPYLFEIMGHALVSGHFKLTYSDKTFMEFDVIQNL